MALQPTISDQPVTLESGWVVSPSGVKLFRIDTYGIWLYDKRRRAEICLTFAQVLHIIAANLSE